jgi:WD40 repeat protein
VGALRRESEEGEGFLARSKSLSRRGKAPLRPIRKIVIALRIMAEVSQAKVFISYAHQDGAALAGRLLQDLKREDWDVWLDSARLTGGASWTAEIEEALDRSDVVLALLSRGSYFSDTCRAEQLRSLRKCKCVIPVLVEADADRPIHLESKQYLDFSTAAAYELQFPKLLECIRTRSGAALNSQFRHTYITVPPLPTNYVQRTDELQSLRAAVLRDGASRRVAITALKGMAGIGKTVLAQALCLDEVTQAAFPDGIIWVPVGKDPRDLVPLLREAGKAVGDSLDGYDSLQSASNRLRNRLSDKAALIVLDDLWDARDAAPFLLDSPRSRIIITTRDARTAVALGAQQQELAVLTWDQSLQLIALWADVEIAKLPAQAAEIVRECACLPLAVAMVGAQLRGKPERWDHVLQKLRNADLERIRQSFPEYPHPDLLRAIDVSLEDLPDDLRQRYQDFAVFPEDCAIPEAAVGTLWNLDEYEVADSVDQLVDLSLAIRDTDRRLRIHDLVLDYLRRRLGGDNLIAKHRALLESYARKCSNEWPQGPNDGYFFENLIWHLRSARQSDDALRLLTDFRWMQAKLDACGITPLLADYDWFAPRDETARLLQEALRLSAYVLAMDRTQLAGQLLGRLSESSPAVDSVRRQAVQYAGGTWLRPFRRLLTPPGGALMFTLASHTARVRSLALSPNGARAVSGSEDHTVRVWDLRRGTLERTLTGHSDAIRAVAVLPDGESAVSAADDHTLRVWNLSTGRQGSSMDTQLDWIRGLVALPRTSRVASISDDRTIRIWDLVLGRVVSVLRGHSAEVSCAAMMPDGESLITGGDDRTLRIWTLDGQTVSVLKAHSARITALAVSGTGLIISISADGAARLWTGGPQWQAQVLSWKLKGVRSATFSPDGITVIAASDDNNVHIWDLANQRERVLEGHSDWVNCVAVVPDGGSALSGSDDGTLKLWDLRRLPAAPPARDHADRVRAVGITSDGLTAVSTSDDHTLRIWEVATKSTHSVLRNQHHWVFAVIPGVRRLVSSGSSGSCSVWDLDSGQELQRFNGHQDRVRALAVAPCGTLVISGSDDRTIRVWEVDSAKEILKIPLVRQWPRSIAVTSDGRFAVTAAESSTVKVWNLETGAEVQSFRGHSARVNSVAIVDAQRVVSGSDDHTVRVWDLESGQPVSVLSGHDAKVNAVAAFGGRKLVVSASDDCDVRVWDVTTKGLLATYTVESPVLTCAGSPETPEIVVGDRSGLVHFFSLEGIEDLSVVHG